VEIIAEAEDGQVAKTNFAVDRNVFKVSQPDAAEFGLLWFGENPEAVAGGTGAG
jgi:hypothetical protein